MKMWTALPKFWADLLANKLFLIGIPNFATIQFNLCLAFKHKQQIYVLY